MATQSPAPAPALASLELLVSLHTGGGSLGMGLSEDNVITRLMSGGAAEANGGLRVGDRIVRFDGVDLNDPPRPVRAVLDKAVEPHELLVLRGTLPAAAAPPAAAAVPPREQISVTLHTINGALGMGLSEDNVITRLAPGGAAEANGVLRVGDRIVRFDGVDLNDPPRPVRAVLDKAIEPHELSILRA